jgi:hypothetical protein
MRKFLWIILTVLFIAIAAPNAHADGASYTITFTGTDAPTVVGSNVLFFDSTLNEFTTPSFVIDFFGNDMTLDATLFGPTNPLTDTYVWGATEFVFDFSDFTSDHLLYQGSAAETGCQFGDQFVCGGDVVLTRQMPEPPTYGLVFVGIGLVLVMRKRIGRRLQQAS